MVLKYSKLITVTGAITREPVTVLVEMIETDGFQAVAVHSLEGEYPSAKEFDKDFKDLRNGKIKSFLPLTVPDTQRLTDALTEALRQAES